MNGMCPGSTGRGVQELGCDHWGVKAQLYSISLNTHPIRFQQRTMLHFTELQVELCGFSKPSSRTATSTALCTRLDFGSSQRTLLKRLRSSSVRFMRRLSQVCMSQACKVLLFVFFVFCFLFVCLFWFLFFCFVLLVFFLVLFLCFLARRFALAWFYLFVFVCVCLFVCLFVCLLHLPWQCCPWWLYIAPVLAGPTTRL